jgi:hypothetical protein
LKPKLLVKNPEDTFDSTYKNLCLLLMYLTLNKSISCIIFIETDFLPNDEQPAVWCSSPVLILCFLRFTE